MKKIQWKELSKLKRWLFYLAYIGLFFAELCLETFITTLCAKNQKTANTEYVVDMTYVFFTIIIFNIIIGATMGLEHFLKEIKKAGKLRINIPKLILMGIPSLYLTPILFVFYGENKFTQLLYGWIGKYLVYNANTLVFLFQYLLGYIIITSFYKEDIAPEVNELDENNSEEESFIEEEEMEAQNVITYDYGNITSFRKETNSIDTGSKHSEIVHSQERFR